MHPPANLSVGAGVRAVVAAQSAAIPAAIRCRAPPDVVPCRHRGPPDVGIFGGSVVFRVIQRASGLFAIATPAPLAPSWHPRPIGSRSRGDTPGRLVAIPMEPEPPRLIRAPWGEPDEPIALVTITTRVWPVSRPLPGHRDPVVPAGPGPMRRGMAQPLSTASRCAGPTMRPRRWRRLAASPDYRRAVSRVALVALSLFVSLIAAQAFGRAGRR
jgi:hypothetical protein